VSTPGPADGLDDPFRALADASRRRLLDALYVRDGQTLGDLCAYLPQMTRFGVMKHLRLLEDAGLVASRKVGREKFHYLNPVHIRLIYDRWIRKYEPWAGALVELKTALEAAGDRMSEQPPTHVYEVYIRTSPERLWQAITSPEYTTRYFYGGQYETSWQPGSAYRTVLQDGTTPFEGTILEADPPRRLVYTFHYVGDPETAPEHASRVTWEIAPVGGAEMCKLSVVHDGFAPGEVLTYRKVGGGWPFILSNLKTLLETGEVLPRSVP
jgi:uncharacterized protein YndB with AHSA1/START domain/DNA-binding transcriptional ArsR family regulator